MTTHNHWPETEAGARDLAAARAADLTESGLAWVLAVLAHEHPDLVLDAIDSVPARHIRSGARSSE